MAVFWASSSQVNSSTFIKSSLLPNGCVNCMRTFIRTHYKSKFQMNGAFLTSLAWQSCLHCISSEMKRWTSKRFPFSSGHSVGAVLIMGSERAERAAKVKTNKHIDNRAIFGLKWKKNGYSIIIPRIYYFQYVQHVPESFFCFLF